MSALSTLQVDSLLSYLIAFIIPALDAVFPVLPGETAVIALGVATAGSTDPRIALLIACVAGGAFIGDNLCYLLGRRFGPAVQRRFFATPKGMRGRAWAERSLERFGPQLIVVCRFIPGGRTAVTLTCGLTGYPRRRFVPATAVAAVIWALYAFFIGRIGGQAFEDNPWVGLVIAFAASVAISLAIEVIRRLWARRPWKGRSRRHAGQVEPDHAGQDQGDRDELHGRDRVAQEDHADRRRPRRADPGPYRVGGTDVQVTQRHVEQAEAGQCGHGEAHRGPQDPQPVAQLQARGEGGLEESGGH
jgi:membrane protein DedA with SNARE-associated domain